ncbi:hypothetical protein JD844_032959, partial [Phrynosoma platyrhinos]
AKLQMVVEVFVCGGLRGGACAGRGRVRLRRAGEAAIRGTLSAGRCRREEVLTWPAAIMEGCGKKSSLVQQKFEYSVLFQYRIPKKVGDTQSEDVYYQSPLSRLADARQWDHPFQGLKYAFPNFLCIYFSGQQDQEIHFIQTGKGKDIQRNIASVMRNLDMVKTSNMDMAQYRQPKVILTNVLKTEIGRKYTKTQLITDANLSHGVKLQSDQQTSSPVDTVEIWQILSPLHESLFISERQPKVILTNVLRTKTGRKYMQRHLLTDANLADANKLQSDEQASSPIATLESCQKISSQQRRILSKRYGRYRRKPNDQNQSKDTESNNALLSIRRCDVVLEDCNVKYKGDWLDKGRRDSKSPCLREATFQYSESRKRRGNTFPNQQNAYSPQNSPLPSKEEKRESTQSSLCMDLNKNHINSFQQEDNPQPVEFDNTEKFTTIKQDTLVNCPDENSSNSSPCRSQHSVIRKDNEVSPLTTSPRKKKMTITVSPKEPLNEPERHKETIDSAEPIVLSSDEEGNAEAKEPKKYFQAGKNHPLMKKELEQKSELPLSEELSDSVTGGKTEQVSDEPLKLQPSTDCSPFSELVDLVLDIKFENLFIGKYKGRATHCARFTTGYIKIPFEVVFNKKMELSVDLLHLRRFGLWTNNHLGSNVVIFLWLSSDYVEQIEKEIGTSILNKQAKNTEFIFITRSQPLTEEEHIILKKIIMEVSKKNSFPGLTESIPWEQAIKEIPREENSFMNYCYQSFQEHLQKDTTSILTEQPKQQESKAILTKPSYTLLQKQSNGLYSFSISCTEMNRWKELRENGPIKNLIVYPPPPAKGGLGVTREDLECLEYGEFLNDVIIDFYLKIAQRRHRRVKRWTRYVNIFSKDYIFVPVNEESHWYIAIICFPWLEEVIYEDYPDQCTLPSNFHRFPHQTQIKSEAVRTESVLVFSNTWNDKEELDINSSLQATDIQPATVSPGLNFSMSKSFSSNSKIKKVCKRPCILILDSLKASSSRNTIQVLREYLEAEWEANCKTCREFSKSSPIVNFEFPMHLERWFPRQVVRSKREEIRDLILQLHLQQQSGSKS